MREALRESSECLCVLRRPAVGGLAPLLALLTLPTLVWLLPLEAAARPGRSEPGGSEPARAAAIAIVTADISPGTAEGAAWAYGWADHLRHALEHPTPGLEPVDVRRVYLGQESLPGRATPWNGDRRAREAASAAGAPFAIEFRLAELAGRYSVEARVLGAAAPGLIGHAVALGEGLDGLPAALEEAADHALEALEPVPPVEPVEPAGAGALAHDAPGPPSIAAVPVAQADEPIAPPEAVGQRVSEIRVEGNLRIEADAIKAAVGTQPGDRASARQVAEDVRRVYALGFFRDVRVTAEETLDGLVLTFFVEENPIIRQVSITGNDNIGSEEVQENLSISVGSTVDYPLLLENERRIEALYAAQGYHQADVEYEIEPLGQQAVGINFDIREGKKLRLLEIDFVGNEFFEDDDLVSEMQTKPWQWYSLATQFFDRSGKYLEPVFLQDLDRVSRKYMDNGFIRVRIGEPKLAYDDEGLRISVSIEEGPQYLVGAVGVIGDESMDRNQLSGLVELTPGDVFSRGTLTEDVERLRGHYADRGFFFAKVNPRTHVDDDARRVHTEFEVEKGEIFFVERIEVSGNTKTRDQVVRRELSLAEGGLYSADALRRSRARVQRLGFFEEVAIEAKAEDEPNKIGVTVDVVERSTGAFSFGAGFGSTDGFILNGSLRQDNLFGRGWALQANVNFGSDNSLLFLRFSDPAVFNSSASLSTTISISKTEFIDFDEEISGFDFAVGYPLDEGETRVFGAYSLTQRDATGFDVQAASLLQREEFQGEVSTSLVSLSGRRDTRDDPRFPRAGQSTGFALEFAGLGGLSEFLRMEGRTTWYIPIERYVGFDSTFVVNSRIGWVLPFNSIGDFDLPGCTAATGCLAAANAELQPLTNIDTDLKLPLTERYFLGGVGSFQVRGFRQRSLGPRRAILNQIPFGAGTERLFFATGLDPTDSSCTTGAGTCNSINDTDIDDFEDLDLADTIGGNKMFLLNLELRFPISEELGLEGLVFFDMGNAFAENENINPADMRFGVGAGARWFSPFGPILVQMGIPLDPLEDEDSFVPEFSFGGSSF